MRILLVLLFFCVISARAALAGAADAREVARLNNCPPKKIEVISQIVGPDSQTVYRVECNMPKTADGDSPQSVEALLVQCSGTLCDMLRPVAKGEKK